MKRALWVAALLVGIVGGFAIGAPSGSIPAALGVNGEWDFYDGIKTCTIAPPTGCSSVAITNASLSGTGADAGFRDIVVAGDAGVLTNFYVAGAATLTAATVNGSPVATYANGQAGGSIEMYHPAAYTGAKAVARVVEHPINANTQVSLSWVPQVAGSVGGTMAVYLKDVTAGNHVIAGLNSISCTSVAGTLTGALYLADGGADAGDTIGIYVDVGSCSGSIPDGTADVSW